MYYLFIDLLVCLHCESVCLHWKIRRFTAYLDSKIHTRLAIVTANELALAFPPRNLPKKISSRSVHVLFSYRGNRQTDRQPDRQTYAAGDYIIPAKRSFRGDNNGLYGGMSLPLQQPPCSVVNGLTPLSRLVDYYVVF